MKRFLGTYISGRSAWGQLIREFPKTSLLVLVICITLLLWEVL
jgi:hypothetical protein